MTGAPPVGACEREIEALHAFFVEFYAGALATGAIERLDRVLAPGFEMVRENHARFPRGPFDIEIRAVEAVATGPGFALLRYEEHQTTGDGDTARVSTALFRPDGDAPEGVVWAGLHETWLDGPD